MTDETAIVITAFNRPSFLRSLLESLRSSPFPIYVSIDCAKIGDYRNQALVAECEAIALEFSKKVVEIRLPQINQGCFLGVSSAISWGFTKASRLIILEDDILPTDSFLHFLSQLLIEFQSDNRVGSIGGTNLVPDQFITDSVAPYRFSAYSTSWGWATWFDRWEDYERDLPIFPNLDFDTPSGFWSKVKKCYWNKIFRATATGKIDTWDYRWLYSNWKNNRLAVIPNANLVLNVGFGADATHTHDTPWWLPNETDKTYTADVKPLPPVRDLMADRWMEANHFRSTFSLQVRNAISSKYPRITAMYRKHLRSHI